MEMNWQQRHALKLLAKAESVLFRDLLPEGIDANQFSYHLKKLATAGYVVSDNGLYSLTQAGKHLVGSISLDTGKVRKQPKIVVMLYAENENGEVLLYRWKRQPYFDKVSLPYGKTQFDKNLEECVYHEAAMKLSVSVESCIYIGNFYQKIVSEGVVLSHMLVHVYRVCVVNGELVSQQPGEAFWADTKDLDQKELMPGFNEILGWIKQRLVEPQLGIVEFNNKFEM